MDSKTKTTFDPLRRIEAFKKYSAGNTCICFSFPLFAFCKADSKIFNASIKSEIDSALIVLLCVSIIIPDPTHCWPKPPHPPPRDQPPWSIRRRYKAPHCCRHVRNRWRPWRRWIMSKPKRSNASSGFPFQNRYSGFKAQIRPAVFNALITQTLNGLDLSLLLAKTKKLPQHKAKTDDV